MTLTYRVVIKGPKDGFTGDQVAAALAPVFRVAAEALRPILDRPMHVVKSGVEAQTAARYQAALDAAGCRCVLEAEQSEARRAAPAPDAPASALSQPGQSISRLQAQSARPSAIVAKPDGVSRSQALSAVPAAGASDPDMPPAPPRTTLLWKLNWSLSCLAVVLGLAQWSSAKSLSQNLFGSLLIAGVILLVPAGITVASRMRTKTRARRQ